MTEQESLISEIIDRILKAAPDKTEGEEEYIERSRIVRIVRGWE